MTDFSTVTADRCAPSGRGPRRAPALAALAAVTVVAAVLRFYNLGWGAPYYHFHIDEHFVFAGAEMLRRSVREAAMSPKFFMYGPLPMYLLNVVVAAYEWLVHPLVLTIPRDEVTYMLLGRGISAAFGTATVPLVYWIATRLSGRGAGLLAAALTAFGVLHLRESHFFSVDVTVLFFAVVTWILAMRIAERGRTADYAAAGAVLGAALACKYSAAFLVLVLLVAHLASPRRPARLRDRAWVGWAARGVLPLVIAGATFLAFDPMAIGYYAKFRQDIKDWVADPFSGSWRPIFVAQFADVQPQAFWFTNMLWWGLGPAFELWGLAGVAWLLFRRDRLALTAAAFPIAYYAAAGQTIGPMARYGVPLVPALAVAGGVMSADLWRRRSWRVPAAAATGVVLLTTALWALAYMNVYVQPDSRLTASTFIMKTVPPGSAIVVEPHHNIPPLGGYLTAPSFYRDYVMWGAETSREDYFRFYTLDVYRFLYDHRVSPARKEAYIARRLALGDWLLMDDTFLQFYRHLPEAEHGVVKRYYADLFAGRLGFTLVKTFKVYPALFGFEINDDGAELSFRLFDHPRVFLFRRTGPAAEAR